MIIVKLMGGLGNQMFQYATGFSLAKRFNVPLKIDTTHYEHNGFRSYMLDKFNVSAQKATQHEIESVYKDTLLNRLKNKLGIPNQRVYKEVKPYYFDQKIQEQKDTLYLDGYWQSEKYFKEHERELRKEFTLKNPLPHSVDSLMRDIENSESVSIHVRRSDYLAIKNQKIFMAHGVEYYQKAIEIISQKISHPKFFIFSDELEFAHSLPFPADSIFVDKKILNIEDYEELVIMSRCKHTITANSTFSWWAGWLNIHPNKTVITPKKWFVNENLNTGDIIPPTWIQI